MSKIHICSSGSARPAEPYGPLFRALLPTTFESDADAVLAILEQHQGAKHAITSKRIAEQLHLSTRQVRAIIAELVNKGALIGASVDGENGGYYMITSKEELESTRAILRSRAREIFARDAALRRAWQRIHGQALQPLLPLEELTS